MTKHYGFLIVIAILLLVSIPVTASTGNTSTNIFGLTPGIWIENGDYWFNLDPISNFIVGDRYAISGTTNLPAGKRISMEFSKLPPWECQACVDAYGVITGAEVKSGTVPGINTFSIPFSLAGKVPDEYYLRITSDSHENPTDIFGISVFVMPAETKTNLTFLVPHTRHLDQTPRWLLIDGAPSDDYEQVADHFTITGLTNLPVGEKIPYTINDKIVPEPDRGEVVPGNTSGINRFVVVVNTTGWRDDYYTRITMWNPYYNGSEFNSFLSTTKRVHYLRPGTSTSPPLPTATSPTATSLPALLPCIALASAGALSLVWRKYIRM